MGMVRVKRKWDGGEGITGGGRKQFCVTPAEFMKGSYMNEGQELLQGRDQITKGHR